MRLSGWPGPTAGGRVAESNTLETSHGHHGLHHHPRPISSPSVASGVVQYVSTNRVITSYPLEHEMSASCRPGRWPKKYKKARCVRLESIFSFFLSLHFLQTLQTLQNLQTFPDSLDCLPDYPSYPQPSPKSLTQSATTPTPPLHYPSCITLTHNCAHIH